MKRYLFIFLVTLFLPAQLFAASGKNLLKYAPANSKVVFGVDIAQIKGTKLFKKGITYLRANAAVGSPLHFALNNGVVDVEKNVSSVLVASKAPRSMNPNNIKAGDSVIIVEGNFDLKKIKSALKAKNPGMTESASKSGFEILKFNKTELGLLNEKVIVLANSKNAKLVWDTVEGAKKSVESQKAITKLLAITNLTQGVWAVAAIANTAGPSLKGTSISSSLKSGLSFIAKTVMKKAKDAKQAKEDLEKMVASQGPMAKAFGAGELVDNLKLSIERKKTVRIQTKISNKAVLKLLVQLESMLKAQVASKRGGKKARPMPKRQPAKKADFN